MSDDTTSYIVVPFNPLPAEKGPDPTPESILEQKQFIRDHIINKLNVELVKDQEAMLLLNQLGSDLNINAFACNFRLSRGGPPNQDVVEASYLNKRIIERLSVTRADDEAQKKPVLLMGSELDDERYGACLKAFKQRLGLRAKDPAPLAGLCNVSMSPFPTAGNLVRELADAFRKVAEEEVQVRFSLLREDLANADRRRIAGSECMLRRLSTASSCREQRISS